MFYMGISSAVSIRVGNAVGRTDMPAIRLATKAGILAGVICVIVFISLMIGLHDLLPGLYIHEAEVVLIAGTLLMIAAIFQFFDGMQAIIMGALRGISDVNIPTGLTFVAYWVIGLPGAWFFSEILGFGVQGIWYGLTLGLGFSSLMLGLRIWFKLRGESLEIWDRRAAN
jgi:MATE family multidrug resistance protein